MTRFLSVRASWAMVAAVCVAGACGGSAVQPFFDATGLLDEAKGRGALAEGVVYLKREVRVEVDAASDPARAESRVTIHLARARYGTSDGVPEEVELVGQAGATVESVAARWVGPGGTGPLKAELRPAPMPGPRVDPMQEAWKVALSGTPPGSVVEVIATLVVPGTLTADARYLGEADGPTRELFLRYELPDHGDGALQVRGAGARPVVTGKDGMTLMAILLGDLAPRGADGAVARYVTRSMSPRNYDQRYIRSWADVAAPYFEGLVARTESLRAGYRAPVAPQASGEDAVKELARWTRDRIQRPDALEAPWDAARELPSLVTTNDLDATDKVHLLVWLLDEAGLSHRMAIGRRACWPALDPDFPTPSAFEIPLVYDETHDLWLDPACRECEPGQVRPALRGGQALILPPGAISVVALPEDG